MQSRNRNSVGILILILLGLVFETQPVSASSASAQDRLRVGVDGSFAPLSFKDSDGQLKGMDIDIAEQLSRALKLNLELQPGTEEQLRSKLFGGEIDIVIAGTFATFGDRHDYEVIPYVEIPGQWIVAGNAKKNTKIHTIGTVSFQLLREYFELTKKNLKISRVRGYEKFDSIVLALDRKEVDAIPVDVAHAPPLIAKIKTPTRLIDMKKHGIPVYSLIRKSSDPITQKLIQELNKLIANGTTEKICSQNFKTKCFKPIHPKNLAKAESKTKPTVKAKG